MAKHRKIIILGIDCLDYHLVRKWRLEHYILDSFGYHFVGQDLYTPVIWAKFLTGINVMKHGFNSKRLSKIKRIKSLYYLNYFIKPFKNFYGKSGLNRENIVFPYLLHDPATVYSKTIRWTNYNNLTIYERVLLKLLVRASYTERLPLVLFKKTFLNMAMQKGYRTLIIEFPTINDNIYSIIRNALYFYIDAPINKRMALLEHVWKTTKYTLGILLKKLNDYDLILWYTPYLDIASHMFYKPKNPKYMLKLHVAYKKLGDKIQKILSSIYDDAVVLVVSDHGYNPKNQDHSHFGYWSSNSDIFKEVISIEDFAPIIKSFIKK